MATLVKRALAVAVAAAAVLAAGCSATAHPPRVSGPTGAAATGQASWVTAVGLPAGRKVEVTITSTDARGVRWREVSHLSADAHGQLRFDAGGLISAMRPLDPAPAGAYVWGGGIRSFRVVVAGGGTTVQRQLTLYPVHPTQVHADGLVGTFYSPAMSGRHSAVLLIGGSEGGTPGPLDPFALAGQGHPVLALAYFKAAGLPPTLSRIPLEYFATALRWLSHQPGVDPAHLIVDGASRGGEAALLIGATFPNLVHGVIARVPANVAVCGFPDCAEPAWTLHGKPVPFTREFDNPHPTDDPNAVIAVQRIDGPILVNCGERDTIWHSCSYAQAVMTELTGSRFPHHLDLCAACDHFVGRGLPDEPYDNSGESSPSAADVLAYRAFFADTLKLLGD